MADKDVVPVVPEHDESMGASVVLVEIVKAQSEPSPKYPDMAATENLYALWLPLPFHLEIKTISAPTAGKLSGLKCSYKLKSPVIESEAESTAVAY